MLIQSHFIAFHGNNFFRDKGKGNFISGGFDYAVYFYHFIRLIFEDNSLLGQMIDVTLHNDSATQYAIRQCIVNLRKII